MISLQSEYFSSRIIPVCEKFQHRYDRERLFQEVNAMFFVQQRTDYSGDLADFRTALQRLREDLDRLKQLIQDLINKGNLSSEDIEVSQLQKIDDDN